MTSPFRLAVFLSLFSCVTAEPVTVVLETEVGEIEIEVLVDQAPVSAGSFLAYVDAGLLDGGGFYRTVNPANDNGSPKISVIQGGLLPGMEGLPPVEHESTASTGIKHLDGVVSLARSALGTGHGGMFFICLGDQPSLDLGGGRAISRDGQGFAAFARVTKGMKVVRQIHEAETVGDSEDAYTAGQIIDPPIRIRWARRTD